MPKGSISERRKKVMDKLIQFMNIMDPSGQNAKNYKEQFEDMSDSQFDKYMTEFLNDEKRQFYLEVIEYERDLTIQQIKKCADWLNVPLLERVALPYLTDDEETVIVTPEPVPVGYIHEKRMPQTLMKKSAGSTEIEKRSILTGQVTGDDKNARNSDIETYAMSTLNAKAGLQEFMGPRADNKTAKDEMISQISRNGYTSLADLNLADPYNKPALNTFNAYYLMQGIQTNLITTMNEIPGPRE